MIQHYKLKDVEKLLKKRSDASKEMLDAFEAITDAASIFAPLVLGPQILFALEMFEVKDKLFGLGRALIDFISSLEAPDYLGREEKIKAAYALICYTAYFETFANIMPADVSKSLKMKLENSLKQRVGASEPDYVMNGLPQRPDVHFDIYFADHSTSFSDILIILESKYKIISDGILKLIMRAEVYGTDDEKDKLRYKNLSELFLLIPKKAVDVYKAQYLYLADKFSDFAFFATMNEFTALGYKVDKQKMALDKLVESSRNMDIGLSLLNKAVNLIATDYRKIQSQDIVDELKLLYNAYIDRPIFGDKEILSEVESTYLICPKIKDAFIPQSYKNLLYDRNIGLLEDEAAWEKVPEKKDLGLFFVNYLNSPDSVDYPLVILGHPGSGKSLLTKVLSAQLMSESFTVIRIPLRDVDAESRVDILVEDQIKQMTNRPLTHGYGGFAAQFVEKPLIIILDGYDELFQAKGGVYSGYLEKVRQFQQDQKSLNRPIRVIVTSRITLIDKVRVPEHSTILRLMEFSKQQRQTWIDIWNRTNANYFAQSGNAPFSLIEESKSRKNNLLKLAEQPLLLLMLAIYDSASNELAKTSTIIPTELYDNLLKRFTRREQQKRDSVFTHSDIYEWDREKGVLLWWFRYIENNEIPLVIENSFDDLYERFKHFIRSSDYSAAFELLSGLEMADKDRYEILINELEFLFERNISLEENKINWKRYKDTLEDKIALWDFLKHDYLIIPADELLIDEEVHQNISKENYPVEQEKESDTSQKIGEDLEISVADILKELFIIDNAELLELRKQLAGTQNGFDIKFKYKDEFDLECNCRIECKSGNQKITSGMICSKLDDLRRTKIADHETIHHWILISPKGNKANDVDDALKLWEDENRWDPIQNVQVWNHDCNVNEFFGIKPDVFKKYYPNDKKINPDKWSVDYRKKVVKNWKDKIKPTIPLPKAWKVYFNDPSNLLTHTEQDSKNREKYNDLFSCHSDITCLDEIGNFISESAEDYIVQWAKRKDDRNQALLILGEYGDGKTFLTYCVSRILAEEFKKSPSTGVIPIRFTLGDFKENVHTQDFLRTRLESFGAQLIEFKELKMNYPVVIILDGFDEMSLNMDSTTIARNIFRLRDCINESFKGLKLIITSRTPIYKKFRHLLPGRIDINDTIRLASISRANKISYIKSHIPKNDYDMVGRFDKLCHTHDLLGLASKALYLDMMKDTLLGNADIESLDKIEIYKAYVNSTLNRKRVYLEHDGPAISFEEVFEKLMKIMEDIALIIFKKYHEGVTFKYLKKYHHDHLATQLWRSMTTQPSDDFENTGNRIFNRSLLKATDLEDTYTFCHRSMQEYFAAKAICRLITENPEEAKELFSKTDLTFETIDFISDILRALSGDSKKIKTTLISLVEKTRGQSKDDESVSRLGATVISIYFKTWKTLPDIDYSNLVMDNAFLPEADFSNKQLVNASLRNANLDNAIFNNADLTLCDLTGVRFEETKDIFSMRVANDPSDGEQYLYVLYSDGRIRKWRVHDNKRIELAKDMNCANIGMPYFGLVLYQKNIISFVKNVEDGIELCGGVALDEKTKILDILGDNILFSKDNKLAIYNIRSKKHVLFERYSISTDLKGIIINDTSILVFSDSNRQEIVKKHDATEIKYINLGMEEITAMAVIQDKKRQEAFILCIGDKFGKLILYYYDALSERKGDGDIETLSKMFDYDCKQYVRSIYFLDRLKIAYSGMDGIVYVIEFDETGNVIRKLHWRLAVSCKGAILDELKQQEQYEKLIAFRDSN